MTHAPRDMPRLAGALCVGTVLAACTGNRQVNVRRVGVGLHAIEVRRCAPDGKAAATRPGLESNRLDRAARRQYGGNYRFIEQSMPERAWLGTAVLGQCPAVRINAVVYCEET